MAQNSHQNKLANALLDGAFETPLWTTFLERLREATGSAFATLIFQPPGWGHDEALHLISGNTDVEQSLNVYRSYFYEGDPTRRELMAEGKSHSLARLLEFDAGAHADFFDALISDYGISDVRQLRVCEASGVDAWLSVMREETHFDETTDAILEDLAPVLRGVLRFYVARERDRFTASMAEEVNGRLRFGWLALDRTGRIVGMDKFCEEILAESGVLGRERGGKLVVRPTDLERDVMQAIAELAEGKGRRARAISLSSDPWLDMLLVPAKGKTFGAVGEPAVIAYVHSDNWRSSDRCGQLIDLFGLTPSEARLALALCRGRSLTEAAGELGLKVETARSYSKAIYSKTGVKGMHDLVRVIMGSVLALAPDHA